MHLYTYLISTFVKIVNAKLEKLEKNLFFQYM